MELQLHYQTLEQQEFLTDIAVQDNTIPYKENIQNVLKNWQIASLVEAEPNRNLKEPKETKY